jgi:hypothetical protein
MLSIVRNSKLSVYHLIACAAIFAVSGLLYLSQHHFHLRAYLPSKPPLAYIHPPAPPPLDAQAGYNAYNGDFRKPPGLKIVGLVFYGRKEFVEILNCYLQVRASPFRDRSNPASGTSWTMAGFWTK